MVIVLACMCVYLLYRVTNDNSPDLSCVVETMQGQGARELALQANKRVICFKVPMPAYTYGPSSSSGPCYCPLLASPHMACLVKNFDASIS